MRWTYKRREKAAARAEAAWLHSRRAQYSGPIMALLAWGLSSPSLSEAASIQATEHGPKVIAPTTGTTRHILRPWTTSSRGDALEFRSGDAQTAPSLVFPGVEQLSIVGTLDQHRQQIQAFAEVVNRGYKAGPHDSDEVTLDVQRVDGQPVLVYRVSNVHGAKKEQRATLHGRKWTDVEQSTGHVDPAAEHTLLDLPAAMLHDYPEDALRLYQHLRDDGRTAWVSVVAGDREEQAPSLVRLAFSPKHGEYELESLWPTKQRREAGLLAEIKPTAQAPEVDLIVATFNDLLRQGRDAIVLPWTEIQGALSQHLATHYSDLVANLKQPMTAIEGPQKPHVNQDTLFLPLSLEPRMPGKANLGVRLKRTEGRWSLTGSEAIWDTNKP